MSEDDPVIHPRWRAWIAQNLARGADPKEIVEALAQEAVPADLANACIEELQGSPALGEARRLWNQVQALEAMVRMRGQLREAVSHGRTAIERRPLPSVEEFLERYWVPGTPIIFTDLVTRWPAFARWSAEDLSRRFGDVEIEASVGRSRIDHPDADWEQVKRSMPLREYLQRIENPDDGNDAYIIAKNGALSLAGLSPLLEEFGEPKTYFPERLDPKRMALWLGPAGTHTPLHHDGDNSMFCQVVGRKRFRIAPPESLPLHGQSRGVYSRWDPTTDDELEAGPESLFELTLAPGEALFIPAGWWHQVDALDFSMSVSILDFAWPNDFGWYKPGTLRAGRSAD